MSSNYESEEVYVSYIPEMKHGYLSVELLDGTRVIVNYISSENKEVPKSHSYYSKYIINYGPMKKGSGIDHSSKI